MAKRRDLPSCGRLRRRAAVALALCATLAAGPAFALKSDRSKPMDVAADRLETTENQTRATLEGNVRITQGTLDVRSGTAVVHRGADQEIQRVVLTGAPASLRQDLDEGGRLNASARSIDYDLGTNVVVLTGGVVIEQPRGELRGEKITYELSTGKMTGSGSGEAGRVHLRMNPQATPAKKAN